MAKVTRKRLARGTKITTEHIYTPIGTTSSPSVGHQLNNAGFDSGNLAHSVAPFRINLSIPFIDSRFRAVGTTNPYGRSFAIPFTLPPFQETFAITQIDAFRRFPSASGADLPLPIILDELSVSMDQRAEPCAIVDNYEGSVMGVGTDQGKMDFDSVIDLGMRLGLSQKRPVYFGANAPLTPDDMGLDEVFSADMANPNWLARGPYVMKGINKAIDPYQTYVLTLDFPDLVGKELALVNLNISMRLTHEMASRETAATTQNLPNKGDARQTRTVVAAATGLSDVSVTILTPTANTTIEADTTDGVSHNLGVIDETISEQLTGGRDQYGEVGPLEELSADASYEVVAVPLFGNRRRGGISAREVALEPYVTHGVAGSYLADRRIIPIAYPLTVHHAMLAFSWQTWSNVFKAANGGANTGGATSLPQSANFRVEVGVGIATGLKGDHFDYDQVAYLSAQNPYGQGGSAMDPWNAGGGGTWPLKMVDIVKTGNLDSGKRSTNLVSTTGATDPLLFWDWDLLNVPLVGTGGTGYFSQGHPVYIGRSWTPTAVDASSTYTNDRQDIDGSAPNCEGQEQWIEVRMKISDTGGLETTDDGGALTGDDFVSGYGGHWVYLICKKELT